MGIEVDWYREGKIVIAHCSGNLNDTALLIAATEQINALFDTSDSDTMHLFLVFDGVTEVLAVNQLPDVMAKLRRHPHLEWTFLIGIDNVLFQIVIKVAASLIADRVQVVDTTEDARVFLASLP